MPTVASEEADGAAPAKAWDGEATEWNGLDEDIQVSAQESQDMETNSIPPVPGSLKNVDLDVVNEMNNEWFWSGGGLSSLMAVDPDAMIYPGDFGMNSDNAATLR